jgi:peptidyl-prolyl cis-trans isomerase C
MQTTLLRREVGPSITDEALHARYNQDYAGKPGEQEAHARHILVPTEQEAKDIIAQLKKGVDFAKLAKERSKDPGAADGGDLGWFKRGDMVPAFSEAAFALKPGQFTQIPVQSQFGWHVILLEGLRQAAAPSFDDVKDELRQKMIQEGVQKAVQQARAQVQVVRFNLDGSTPRATDTAEPPPAPSDSTPPAPPAGTPPAGK